MDKSDINAARFGFALPPAVREEVLAIAEREDRSISSTLRQLIIAGLKQRETQPA